MGRVMVIEDEPTIRLVLEELLSDEGYEVTAFADGETGLQRLAGGPPPDVLLVDLLMPGISGKAVVSAVRRDPRLERLQIVLVTGAVRDDRVFPPDGTYQAIISKPFELDDLLDTVAGLMEKAVR